eukprot:4919755-Amphidinium_carterae.1
MQVVLDATSIPINRGCGTVPARSDTPVAAARGLPCNRISLDQKLLPRVGTVENCQRVQRQAIACCTSRQ